MSAPPEETRQRLRSELLSVGTLGVARLLPLRPAIAFGAAAGRLAFRLSPAARARALAQLAFAFPERDEAERAAIARGSFEQLGRAALEAASFRGSGPELDRRVELARPELLRDLVARRRGVILVTGRLGSWALLHPRLARAGLATTRAPRASVERGALPRPDGAERGRALAQAIRRGGAVGVVLDRDAPGKDGVVVPFFGRPASTPRAAAELALRFGAPVLVATLHRKGARAGDGHRVELTEVPFAAEPPDREQEITRLTAACSAVLEAAIRRHPTEWVWMYDRWRSGTARNFRTGATQANPMPKSVDVSAS